MYDWTSTTSRIPMLLYEESQLSPQRRNQTIHVQKYETSCQMSARKFRKKWGTKTPSGRWNHPDSPPNQDQDYLLSRWFFNLYSEAEWTLLSRELCHKNQICHSIAYQIVQYPLRKKLQWIHFLCYEEWRIRFMCRSSRETRVIALQKI